MGVSTDGQLCYGICFEEGFQFPWDELEMDFEDWWYEIICGYKKPFELYDENGEYNKSIPKDQLEKKKDEYHKHRYSFHKENKPPVVLLNYCTYDVPMYIMTLEDKSYSNSRGYPIEIDPANLIVSEKQKNILVDFCKKYIPSEVEEPKWYLSSFWG